MGNTHTAERTQVAEIMIDVDVYDNAFIRADAQGQSLATVCRAILYLAASKAKPIEGDDPPATNRTRPKRRGPEDHKERCPVRAATKIGNRYVGDRPPCECEIRYRYCVPRDAYQAAKIAIHSAGSSITEVLNRGLKNYARTGQVTNMK